MTVASETDETPEYSSTAAPTSALAVGFTVITGCVPPPAVTGADQIVISVFSDAFQCASSTYLLPAESVTLETVEPLLFQTPVSTRRRLPAVIADPGVSVRLVTFSECGSLALHENGRRSSQPG